MLKPKIRRSQVARCKFNLTKYLLLPPCDFHCNKKCSEKFSEENREEIRQKFWERDFKGRREFMRSTISLNKVEKDNEKFKSVSLSYFLSDVYGVQVSVCKLFYTHSLGMKTSHNVTKAQNL